MSNYKHIVVSLSATNVAGNVESVGVQYFLQSGGFNFHAAGSDQTLPADGEIHDLCFSIEGIANLDFVEQHGVNLRGHAGGDLIIDIDNIRAIAGDCPSEGVGVPAVPRAAWPLLALAGLAIGSSVLLLRRRSAAA
ncbi:MAG: hypothetical protein HY721_32825 [Planctomycetes bacterium]|nr:hypothetical protein [Planctomycetota bacterium]